MYFECVSLKMDINTSIFYCSEIKIDESSDESESDDCGSDDSDSSNDDSDSWTDDSRTSDSHTDDSEKSETREIDKRSTLSTTDIIEDSTAHLTPLKWHKSFREIEQEVYLEE